MRYSRREFGKLALAGVPAAAMVGNPLEALAQGMRRPDSTVGGVNLGTITYSYRSMPDQSAGAILGYVVDSGISRIEFMGGPVEAFAGAPEVPRFGGRGQQATPAQQAEVREAQQRLRAWRTSVSMDRFRELRRMFNDAGVEIYAWKQLGTDMTDEEIEYVFNVAEALGNTHVTLELPEDGAALRRLGQFGERRGIYVAYHTHEQGSLTVFDEAFAVSPANMANVDLGHYVAAGGDPLAFMERFHDRVASFHLKDRTTPANGAGNLAWGTGDTPLVEILRMVQRNGWTMPATIELEYEVPAGSDAVAEVRTCLQFCREALA
jgi:sugar phosphate isomerase/epimerase